MIPNCKPWWSKQKDETEHVKLCDTNKWVDILDTMTQHVYYWSCFHLFTNIEQFQTNPLQIYIIRVFQTRSLQFQWFTQANFKSMAQAIIGNRSNDLEIIRKIYLTDRYILYIRFELSSHFNCTHFIWIALKGRHIGSISWMFQKHSKKF